MEFTDKPKNAKIHVPDFSQFKATDDSEKLDYKTEVDKWTPSFDCLPDWVVWIAQDFDGVWYGFKYKPKRDGDIWVNDGYAHHVLIEVTPLHPDGWENTLTKRPEKRSERVSVGGKVNVSVEGMRPLTDEYINQQSAQPHYQTKTGIDFIQRFIDVHSEERVRGALLFSIGKYCERYGDKDDILKEARKIADYANRLVKFEEALLGDRDEIHG